MEVIEVLERDIQRDKQKDRHTKGEGRLKERDLHQEKERQRKGKGEKKTEHLRERQG